MTPQSIRRHSDLITTPEQIRLGFREQALKKTERANIYVNQAIRLRDRLQAIGSPEQIDVLSVTEEMVAAAGFSDKATKYFSPSELESSLRSVLAPIIQDAGEDWRDALVYRFLLTRGDSLGGRMRNITGAVATAKFSQAVMDSLSERNVRYVPTYSPNNPEKIQRIEWDDRVLHFDRTSGVVKKNIDAILLRKPARRVIISQALTRLCTIKRHRLACRASCGTRGAGLLSIRARARTA